MDRGKNEHKSVGMGTLVEWWRTQWGEEFWKQEEWLKEEEKRG